MKARSAKSGLAFMGVLLVTLLLALGAVASAGETGGAPVLVLSPRRDAYPLAPYLEILEDPLCQWSPRQVSSPPLSERFRPVRTRSIGLGITASAYWLRFRVKREAASPDASGGDRPRVWLLHPGFAFPGRVEWLLFNAGAQKTATHLSGPGPVSGYIPLEPSDKPVFYYLRLESTTALMLSPQIISGQAHATWMNRQGLTMGFFYGLMAAVVFYNLFFFLFLKDRSYLWYFLYLSLTALYFFGINGYINELFLPAAPRTAGALNRSFICLMIFFGGLFARSFLSSARNAPLADKYILAFTTAAAAAAVLNLSLPVRIVNLYLVILGISSPAIIMAASVVCLRRGFKPARLFLAAWLFFMAGGLWFAAICVGLAPFTYWGFHSFQAGAGLSAILFSMALGQRVKIMRKERESFKESMERVETILDSLEAGVFIVDPGNHEIVEANQEAARLLGLPKDRIVGRPSRRFIRNAKKRESPVAVHGGAYYRSVETLVAAEETELPVLKRAKAITLGDRVMIVESFVDISELKRAEEKLKKTAETDHLTGADNRRSFLDKAEKEWKRTQRYGGEFSFLMIDIDHFKLINDTFGHQSGDRVLKSMVEKCLDALRETDLFGRMGGEEFAVALSGTDAKQALEAAERLRKILEASPVDSEHGLIKYTVSIGAASLQPGDSSLEQLMKRADQAMYRAKVAGRNRSASL